VEVGVAEAEAQLHGAARARVVEALCARLTVRVRVADRARRAGATGDALVTRRRAVGRRAVDLAGLGAEADEDRAPVQGATRIGGVARVAAAAVDGSRVHGVAAGQRASRRNLGRASVRDAAVEAGRERDGGLDGVSLLDRLG